MPLPRPFASLITAILVVGTPAYSEMTKWMLPDQMERHVDRKMDGGKAYPIAIQCGELNGKAYVRMDAVPFDGEPPFHRWQWLLVKSENVQQGIDNVQLKSRPELKYRVFQSMSFELNGQSMTCAILFR